MSRETESQEKEKRQKPLKGPYSSRSMKKMMNCVCCCCGRKVAYRRPTNPGQSGTTVKGEEEEEEELEQVNELNCGFLPCIRVRLNN